MKNFITICFILTLIIMGVTMSACDADKETANPKIQLTAASASGDELGAMTIELYPEIAPNHVERILTLTKEGFYNGLKFHRVIEGFMVQTGCPYGTGTGSSDYPDLKAEFNDMEHVKGVMSMARSSDPNSANSQFFIMLDNAPHLDHQYTAFGKVIDDIETLDKIKRGNPADNGKVSTPSIIKEMKIIG